MLIRDADPQLDASACAAIYAPYVSDTAVSFEIEPPIPQQMAERIEVASRMHAWLVLEDEGRVVGYAYGSRMHVRAAYRWSCEVSIYLELGRRRTGAGRALYEVLLARLAERGYRTAIAGMTLPNTASVGLHSAMGFKEVGIYRRIGWKAGAWHDVQWWQLDLHPGEPGPPEELSGVTADAPNAVHQTAAEGFARGAGAYERGRPSYPPEAVSWLAEQLGMAPGRRVLDLAAGTGKLTRLLVATGASLIAVEPVAEMRSALAELAPGVDVRAGTAEAIPLPDASVDAVAVAQAFHWFASEQALAEIARVLIPTGRLGLVWNRRDLTLPLQAEISEIIEPHRGSTPSFMTGNWREAFQHTRLFIGTAEHQVPYEQLLTVDQLIDRVLSVSFIAALSPSARDEVEREVRALAQRHDDRPLRLGYVTELYFYARG